MGKRLGLVLALATGAFAQDWGAKLAARDSGERVRAAEALEKIGAAAAVPELIECLIDKSETLRLAATRALGKAGPAAKAALPDLERLFSHGSPKLRDAACEAIARIGDTGTIAAIVRRDRSFLDRLGPEHGEVLRRLLGARSWHVRMWVLQLKKLDLDSPEAWVPLFDSLAENDPAEAVRAWATIRLVRSPAPEAVPSLLRRLQSGEAHMRATGVVGLARREDGGEAVVGALKPLLGDPVPQIRARACLALRAADGVDAALAALLTDPEPRVQTVAAVVLAGRGTWIDASGPLVVRVADVEEIRAPFPLSVEYRRNLRSGGGSTIWSAHERYPSVGSRARTALVGGGKSATPYVVAALKAEKDPARRLGLVYALGHMGAARALAPLLDDSDLALRRNVAACRAHLGESDAATVAILIGGLADADAMDEEGEIEEAPIELGTRYIHWPETAFPLLAAMGEKILPALEPLQAKALTPHLQRERIRRLIQRIRVAKNR